jgi:hypothetical protein
MEQDQDHLEYVQALLRETRDELNRVDTKASILLAGTGVAVTALLGGKWPSATLRGGGWMFWPAVILLAAGLTALGLAVLPRTRSGARREPVMFYGQAARFAGRDELLAAIRSHPVAPMDRAADQLWFLSRIVAAKYQLVRLALATIALAGAGFMLTWALARGP